MRAQLELTFQTRVRGSDESPSFSVNYIKVIEGKELTRLPFQPRNEDACPSIFIQFICGH